MEIFSLQQKMICVAQREQTVRLAGVDLDGMAVLACPDDLQPLGVPFRTEEGWMLALRAGERRLDYACITLEARRGDELCEVEIPTRIFGDKEFFLCMATTSNFHWGYDPGVRADVPDPCDGFFTGDDDHGDAVAYHGHAYKHSRYMAEGVHEFGMPMTWFIDGDVAEAGAEELTDWHFRYGDDVGVLPSSYFHHNPLNYNTDYPVEDAVGILRRAMARMRRALARNGWHCQPQIGAVDQWVGGLGTRWIAAGRAVGLRAFWGICHDHVTCDSSMYHEGAPWDAYRMQPDNFRYPDANTKSLWAFAWTSRDLVNSFVEYPGASTRYSTDPDDIEWCGIMANEPNYWTNIVADELANLPTCDFICFVIHNEDHDAWKSSSQRYIANFLRNLPEAVVPATLEEVRQWLDVRFADGSHPAQLMELHDQLHCHDEVAARTQRRYADWTPPARWKSVNGHNPAVLCFYSAEARWAAYEGERTPAQYIDYRKAVDFRETGSSPKERLPIISDWQETVSERDGGPVLTVTFTADVPFQRLPLIWWDRPEVIGDQQTERTRIRYVDVQVGQNTLEVALEEQVLVGA